MAIDLPGYGESPPNPLVEQRKGEFMRLILDEIIAEEKKEKESVKVVVVAPALGGFYVLPFLERNNQLPSTDQHRYGRDDLAVVLVAPNGVKDFLGEALPPVGKSKSDVVDDDDDDDNADDEYHDTFHPPVKGGDKVKGNDVKSSKNAQGKPIITDIDVTILWGSGDKDIDVSVAYLLKERYLFVVFSLSFRSHCSYSPFHLKGLRAHRW